MNKHVTFNRVFKVYIYYFLLISKLIVGFGLIIAYLYLTGKHQLSKMTPIDFVGNFIIGGAVGGVIYSDSISFPTYIATMLIALFIVYLISVISSRFSVAKAVTVGIPLVIIDENKFRYDTILENKAKIDFGNILSKLHLQGITRFSELRYLQLEPTGEVIAVKKGECLPSVIIFENNGFVTFNLERLNIEIEEIQSLLDKNKLTDIILIEYWNGSITVVTEHGRKCVLEL